MAEPAELVVRRAGREEVDRLSSLWRSLYRHHASLPEMPPTRSLEDSWESRRRQYLEWLDGDAHTLLIAERDGEPIGYAVVAIEEGGVTWDVGERTASLETLSVLEGERGAGVGRALLDAAAEVVDEAGAGTLLVGVAHSNRDAVRFYEREGFAPFYLYLGRR